MGELKVDPSRVAFDNLTGVYIRARMPDGAWVSADIATLTDESLAAFIRMHGPVTDWAMGTVQALLERLFKNTAEITRLVQGKGHYVCMFNGCGQDMDPPSCPTHGVE